VRRGAQGFTAVPYPSLGRLAANPPNKARPATSNKTSWTFAWVLLFATTTGELVTVTSRSLENNSTQTRHWYPFCRHLCACFSRALQLIDNYGPTHISIAVSGSLRSPWRYQFTCHHHCRLNIYAQLTKDPCAPSSIDHHQSSTVHCQCQSTRWRTSLLDSPRLDK
jgi:hypothetical protein